jgi:GGDEF domain-containing protein
MHTHSTTTCTDCQAKDALIAQLRWNDGLGMLNQAGLAEAIRTLNPSTTYTVVFADIDRLKTLNSVTANHLRTNRYLRDGLAVREGELAGQLLGDEVVFILSEHSRNEESHPDAFVARIARQLAGQPLLQSERYALAASQHCHVSDAKLSATFATETGVSAGQVYAAIERLSGDVLKLKAQRDARVKVTI